MNAVAVVSGRSEALESPRRDQGPFPDMTGRRMVVDMQGVMSPLAHRGDVIDVDFDVQQYQGEGIYLLRLEEGDCQFGWGWTGARRLMRQPDGLHVFDRAENGGWQWRRWPEQEQSKMRIFGRVHDIYRRDSPSSRPGIHVLGALANVGGDQSSGRVDLSAGAGRTVTVTGLEPWQVRSVAQLLLKPVKLEITVCAETCFGPGER